MTNKLTIIWCVFCLSIVGETEFESRWREIEEGDVLAWSRHITGQDTDTHTTWDDFKSIAVIYGKSDKACGDTRKDDELWAVVDRGNKGTFIEQVQASDWGSDPNYCWFVDCGGRTMDIWHPAIAATTGVAGTYPTLQVADGTFATTQSDPGLTQTTAISNVTELQAMENDLAGEYYLTGDIDASATSGWNGGAGFDPVGTFAGTLDGCGYTISNLFINRPTESGVGLFSYMRGTIANLTLSNPIITGKLYVAPLVGYQNCPIDASSKVQNCHVTDGEVKAQGSDRANFQGGIIGVIDGRDAYPALVYDCTTSCVVDLENHHSISGINNIGDCGGFTGKILQATVSNCRSTGNVSAVESGGSGGTTVGGFSSSIEDTSTVSDCTATGDVKGGWETGGFAGSIETGTGNTNSVLRCSARGDITCLTNTAGNDALCGGFTGHIYCSWLGGSASTVQDCYAWGDITATISGDATNVVAGVFCADIYRVGVTVDNCYAIGTITSSGDATPVEEAFSNQTAPGLVPTVTNSFWDTEASGITISDYATGHITTWMQTQTNYENAEWDFTTTWEMTSYQPGIDAVPGYRETIDVGYHSDKVCVYADGKPMGTFDVNSTDANDILDFNEDDYTVIIAGLNYYSIFESFPLVHGEYSSIKSVKIDFYESMGCHVGVDLDNAVDWIFSYDDFATAIEPVTEIKNAPFVWGQSREPVIYLWEWEPIPLCVRGVYPRLNMR